MTKVERGLAALHGRWLGGWQIIRETGRTNSNGAFRDIREAALRKGFAWHSLDVSEDDNGPGSHHRLHAITRGTLMPPRHPAIANGATVTTEYPPLPPEIERGIARTEAVVERLRGGSVPQGATGNLCPERSVAILGKIADGSTVNREPTPRPSPAFGPRPKRERPLSLIGG